MSQSKATTFSAVLTLFFVAPFVSEFLLGDFSITMLWLIVPFALIYGGGALLIRELARRTGRGWPTMFLLSAVYCLIEEGFATQSLFNPHYIGLHLLGFAAIPALGIGGWWTVFAFNVHVFWSMGVSIALAEGLFPSRAREPWLGNVGLPAVICIYIVGVAAMALMTLHSDPTHGSARQYAVTAACCCVLAAIAFAVPRNSGTTVDRVPSSWVTGAVAFILGAAVMLTSPSWNWAAVAAILGVDVLFLRGLRIFSRHRAWTPLHTLSLGIGGAMFYGVHAFKQPPAIPSSPSRLLLGHVVFLLTAVCLAVVATRHTYRSVHESPVGDAGNRQGQESVP